MFQLTQTFTPKNFSITREHIMEHVNEMLEDEGEDKLPSHAFTDEICQMFVDMEMAALTNNANSHYVDSHIEVIDKVAAEAKKFRGVISKSLLG